MLRYIRSPCGVALVELVIVLFIVTVLGYLGGGSCARYVDHAKLLRAKYELNLMAPALDIYYLENGEYPSDPSQAGISWPCVGPWGKSYEYEASCVEYTMTALDGGGSKRIEARGKCGASEVVQIQRSNLAGALLGKPAGD